MTQERVTALKKLVNLAEDIDVIQKELRRFEWDSDDELVILTSEAIIEVFKRYQDSSISLNTLEHWANPIEGREDIGYEDSFSEVIKEIIVNLSNPDLYSVINDNKLEGWIKLLSRPKD
jgi:hypothetical protein